MTLLSNMDGDADDTALSESEAADAFLARFMPKEENADDASKKKPSDHGDEDDKERKDAEADDDEESDESPDDKSKKDDSEDDEDADDDEKRKYADDDAAYVKITVGDESHEVPVKDLKRLWGQEAALTQKSQEVADRRKALDTEATKTAAATAALLKRAQERFEPFSKIDFVLAAQQLEAEDYTALRNQAQAAHDDVKFLTQELDGFMKAMETKRTTDLADQAKETIKILSSDPKDGGIEGWSQKMYDEIRAFAVTEGLDRGVVNDLVDASAIKLLHMAMLYKRGASKAVIKTEKKNKTPKKIIKTSHNPESTKAATKGAGDEKAMKKLQTSGSTDDAANAFLARWSKDSDD